MKFTDKKYPFIQILNDGLIHKIPISGEIEPPTDVNQDNIIWATLYRFGTEKGEYQVFSRQFIEKAWKFGKNLITSFEKLADCSGCILKNDGIGIFYFINPQYKDYEILLIVVHETSVVGYATANIKADKAMYTEGFHVNYRQVPNLSINWAQQIWTIVVINLLKQFADTELRYIGGKAGQRKTEIDNVKYLSDLPISVSHYNCSWFIECVSDKEFGVSAHIRLQPCGPGKSLLKFVFVRAYLKHGYHRRARKDLLQISNN